eukprot:6965876-Alexandrium_andersonii.AAC.1
MPRPTPWPPRKCRPCNPSPPELPDGDEQGAKKTALATTCSGLGGTRKPRHLRPTGARLPPPPKQLGAFWGQWGDSPRRPRRG